MREKRMFERIEAPMRIRYEILEKSPESKMATSENISGGGIRLALGERLDEGTNLKLSIEMPNEKDNIATIYGKVVWSKKIEVVSPDKSSHYYETGIEFTKADSIVMGKIFKHFSGKR